MCNQPTRRVARLDKRELADMPSSWSSQERGEYLWLLLRFRGIDPNRLYRVEYFPLRNCWLLIQESAGAAISVAAAPPSGPTSAAFYQQLSAELSRSARSAFAMAAAHSLHFASVGCKYQLPPKPQEISPAELTNLLGGAVPQSAVRFDSEGGWQMGSIAN